MASTPTPAAAPARTRPKARPRSGWLAITGLLLLSALPVLGGAFRLGELAGQNALLDRSPVPLIAHVVAMSAFCLIGAFQFSPALRTRRAWHRTAGRALLPAGFVAALSGIWLAVFFGGTAEEFAMAMVRLVFGVAMAGFLVLGASATRRRDFASHGAWLTRAYAIAVSGGTQALVVALWTIPVGEVDASGETLLVSAGFLINSVVAEVIIARRARASRALVS
ncbi:DUF2306 domain-containing protein [Microbacterium sp.]|uniref:DUF2306 domain-containing protein n=1 Tax=Microbacterium sp. TaxID=51671 RepID=UPI0032218AC6